MELQARAGNAGLARALAGTGQALQRKITSVETDEIDLNYRGVSGRLERPTKVVGEVEPTVTTGRGSPPDPLVFQRFGEAFKDAGLGTRREAIGSIMTHGVYDRGHVMGLQLGGADRADNIVPQWRNLQQNGPWRQLETRIFEHAQHGNDLTMEVEVRYASNGGSFRRSTIPSSFAVTVADKTHGEAFGDIIDNGPTERDLEIAPTAEERAEGRS